ncbi:MAG: ThuA domain-containing protein [Pirellulales bacterium]
MPSCLLPSCLAWTVLMMLTCSAWSAEKLPVLIVDGQNNHDWRATTPVLRRALEDSGIFTVDVATSPPSDSDMSGFRPKFSDYRAVVSNYNGDPWPEQTQRDFEQYVRNGGGFVCVHAANNSFPAWNEYNRIIGLGGWGGRDERWGPYVYFRDDQLVRDTSAGGGGSHGPQLEFAVVIRDPQHPITAGMPRAWLHTKDELYDSLRGPAESMKVLATAFSEKTGRHEPMMMVIDYGQGRIFHTPMGHADYSMNCVGFITTLQRGTEWAATGVVHLPLPEKFPTDKESRSAY